MVLTIPVLFSANTTDATNTSSGSLQVSGGVGIIKNLNVGQGITSPQLISSVGIGTQPLIVSSSTLVPILYVARSLISDSTSSLSSTVVGPIKIVGTTTTITSQTGLGTVFVMNTSPTLITPYIGIANGTSLNLIGSIGTSLLNTGSIYNSDGLLVQQVLVGYGSTAWSTLNNEGLQIGCNNLTGTGATDFLANNQTFTTSGNAAFTYWTTNAFIHVTQVMIATLTNTGIYTTAQYFAYNTTPSTSVSTGAITTQGGIGVASNMWIGSAFTSTNTTTAGSVINIPAFTYTSSTVSPIFLNIASIGQVSVNSVGIASTTANAASLYITGAPASSGSMNIANSFALEVASGSSYFASSGGLGSLSCTWLIVGGGGGGAGSIGGGGGAGGYVLNSTPTTLTGSYNIRVGAGGGGGGLQGVGGSPSSIGTIGALGGGLGNTQSGGGQYGGSGSGAGGNGGSGGSAYNGQGSAGGSSASTAGAGGGGAGAVGSNSSGTVGGAGGAGLTTSISGSSTTYAGGGGGGGAGGGGAGGSGGGGAGGTASGTAGTANTGGGGGGGGPSSGGATGGSGIVIITYPGTSAKATGGTITVSGANIVHKFTSSGSFTILNNTVTTAGSIAIGGTVSMAGPLYLSGTSIAMPNIYMQSIVFGASSAGTNTQLYPIGPIFATGFPFAYVSNGDFSYNQATLNTFYPISCTLLNTTGATINSQGDYITQMAITYAATNTQNFRINVAVIYYP